MRKIAIEAVETASKSTESPLWILSDVPGWITNRHFACRVEDPKLYGAIEHDNKSGLDFAKMHESYLAILASASVMTMVPDLERPAIDKVVEVRADNRPCKACSETGEHECSCGYLHDCKDCDGEGKIKGKIITPAVSSNAGRIVITDGKIRISLTQRFKGLFDGLVIKGNAPLESVFGIDPENGTLLVAAMPMRDREINP